jgi:predicted MFS family arabinose efflux permease
MRMTRSKSSSGEPWKTALGGLLAMAAALGIGRFVYTPILPLMIDALGWSTADAGLVASANFLGYLAGAVIAGWPVFAAAARGWLLIALAVSAATTAGMSVPWDIYAFMAVRFIGGAASAFVIVCASTVVLDRLAAASQGSLTAIHFAGVGAGIFVSAAAVAASTAIGAGWQALWAVSGLLAALAGLFAALLVCPASGGALRRLSAVTGVEPVPASKSAPVDKPALVKMIAAYGLFGFGYVVTATFLVAIVRQSPAIRPLEPWIWMLFGLAAVPSIPMWQYIGDRIGLARAYALACAVEAGGVAASVEWVTASGVCVSAVLLGGTFVGLTALGLMSGRALAGGHPQRVISLMTVSFSAGQMVGPSVAGFLAESTGGLQSASRLAAAALVLAAALAMWSSGSLTRR